MVYILGLPVALLVLYYLVSAFVRVTVDITHRNHILLVIGAILLTVTVCEGGSLVLRYLSQLSGFADVVFILGLSHMWYTFMEMWSSTLYPLTILPIIFYEYYIQVSLRSPGLNTEKVPSIAKKARYVLTFSFLVGFFISMVRITSIDSSGWGVYSLAAICVPTVIAMVIWPAVRESRLSKSLKYSL